MTLALLRGSAFDLDGKRFRAIRFDPERRCWWALRLSQQATEVPRSIPVDVIAAAVETNRCKLLLGDDDPRYRRPDICLSQAERDGRERSVAIVERLLEHESAFLEPTTRVAAIRDVAEHCNVRTEWVRVLIARFYTYGMDWNALVPRHALQGGPGKPRGSPQTAEHRLTEEDLGNINAIATRYFSTAKDRPHSVQDAYTALLKKFYAVSTARNENGFTIALELGPHPSFWQFRHLVKKIGEQPIVRARRFGPAIITGKRRPRSGRGNLHTALPSSCPEFDAWHMSEWKLCSEIQPSLDLPDAMLWMLKDPAPGAVIGRHIDITEETSQSVRTALYYCFTGHPGSRPALIATKGLARFAGEPSHIRMDALGRRKLVEETMMRRRIVVETAPPRQGDKKPWVESDFQTLLLTLHRDIQGGLMATDRANGHVRTDGRVTLRYLATLVDLAIDMLNARLIRRRAMPEGLITPSAALPSREDAFFLMEEQFGIARRHVDDETAVLEYLTDCEARVTELGYIIDGLEYRSDIADRAGFHYRGFSGIPESMPAKKDDADCSRAWVIWPDGKLEALRFAEGQAHLVGIRRTEHALVEAARAKPAAYARKKHQERLVLFDVQRTELGAAQRKALASPAPLVEIPTWREENPDNQPSDGWEDPLARREEEAWDDDVDVEEANAP